MPDIGPRLKAADAVLRAWVVPGSHPAYHQEQVLRLRAEWPALAHTLDLLMMESVPVVDFPSSKLTCSAPYSMAATFLGLPIRTTLGAGDVPYCQVTVDGEHKGWIVQSDIDAQPSPEEFAKILVAWRRMLEQVSRDSDR